MARRLNEIYLNVFPQKKFEDCSEEEQREQINKACKGEFIPGASYNLFGKKAQYSRHFQSCAQNLLVSPKCDRDIPLINCLYVRDENFNNFHIIESNEDLFHVFAFVNRGELYRVRYHSSLDMRLEGSNPLSPSHLNIIPNIGITWVDKGKEHSEEIWSFLEEANLLISEKNRKRRKNLPDDSQERFLTCGTLMGYDLPKEIKQVIRDYAQIR